MMSGSLNPKIDRSRHEVLLTNFLAGGTSSAISKTIVAPVERVKLLLQVQSSSHTIMSGKQYKGIIDCFIRIPKEQGILSFWRGNSLAVMRGFPKDAMNFAIKDRVKESFFSDVTKDRFWLYLASNFTSGSVAGVVSLCFLHPVDFARTRLAADIGKKPQDREFRGIIDCFSKTFRSDGIRGLYRGFLISVPEIIIFRGAYFGLYDTAKGTLIKNPEKTSVFYYWIIAQMVTTVSGLMAYPFDSVRRRMMMQSGVTESNRMYHSTLDCFRKTYAEGGLGSFYKGAVANILRGAGGALILVLYDNLKTLV